MLTFGIFCFALLGYSNGLPVPYSSMSVVQTLWAKVGDTVQLDCSAVIHPSREIFWYKYSVPLLEITYRKLEDPLKSRKLVLDNLLLADSGNYSCHVNNTPGSINRTFILHVYASSSNHPMIVKSLLTNKTAILGSEASFHCHVTSDSVIYVRWYFKGDIIQVNASSNSTHGDIIQIKSISLVKILSFMDSDYNGRRFKGEAVFLVQNISFKDEGEYICEAFNERGKTKFGAFLAVVKGPTPSHYEMESKYAAMFERTQKLPLAILVSVPVVLLIILTAVFIRALERAKQKHGVGAVKKTDINGDVVVLGEPLNSNKESTNQEMERDIAISARRSTPNYIKCNGVHKTGQQTTPLLKKVTCEVTAYSCERPLSCNASDVSSKRCSAVVELEWDGIDLVMEDGFEMVKLSKEEEV